MLPKISVVMSVYNGEKYLREAIESVLNQSFSDFEFIIINDGSIDSSLDIIKSYKDSRINLINNEENKGLIYSLNKGFDNAKGKYIIRFDADDICLKDRFEIQYEYMEKNPEVAMMSAYAIWFLDGKSYITKRLKSDTDCEKIKGKFIFENHINHSCVVLRKSVIDKENYRYNKKYLHIEDYGLWLEISRKYKVSTLDKVLIQCRISKNSVTSTANRDMRERQKIYNVIYDEIYSLLGYNPSEEDYKLHFEISMIQNINSSMFTLEDKVKYLKRILKSNNEQYISNNTLKNEMLNQLYKNAIYTSNYREYNSIEFLESNQISYIKWIIDGNKFKLKKIIKKIIR
ncbi:glycosyltransferase [Clostridium sp.]|uniref:glycosyltransferase family 2 protein n=1 Tax=Clostridium sp. TaxID=1506 RepID=UPI003216FCA7